VRELSFMSSRLAADKDCMCRNLSNNTESTPTAVEFALTADATPTGRTSKDQRAISRLFVGGF
jgi:hypothetical protein